MWRLTAVLAAVLLASTTFAQQEPAEPKRPIVIQPKKAEEPPTQVLDLPKELPMAVVAEADHLYFHVTPLSSKGLLSQQTRDALKWLFRQDRAGIVKLRAFVAGSGDLRRVPAIVSDTFADKRLPLPVLTVVQVGALPREGAQVVLEVTASDPRRARNPDGLAFVSGPAAVVQQPMQPIRPLAEQAVMHLEKTLRTAGVDAADVLRVTCFTSDLAGHDYLRERLFANYRAAAIDIVQQTREPSRTLVQCEAAGRLRKAPPQAVSFAEADPNGHSRIALVAPQRVVVSGMQMAFGIEDNDARLAFQRLGKALEQAGTSYDQVFYSSVYPLAWRVADLVRKIRPEFYRRDPPPAATMLTFEGLPSLDASFGIDVMAAVSPQ